jgi:hypothetical protein
MSLTWLFLGAVIGVFNGLDPGGAPAIVSMMLGGMIVMPIPGAFLGLIGGDARGSLGGSAASLLGWWIAHLGGAPALQPQVMSVIVVIGALGGATGFLFLRFLLWKYTMIFSAACWFLRATPLPARARLLAGHHLLARRPGLASVHFQGRTRHTSAPSRLARYDAAATGPRG